MTSPHSLASSLAAASVLLSSSTDHPQEDLADDYAGDNEGVRTFVDQLTIDRSRGRSAVMPSAEGDDYSITEQVQLSLASHGTTSVLKTMVSTTRGVVTVSGVARSAAERSLVTQLISEIHGVLHVINRMTPAPPIPTR